MDLSVVNQTLLELGLLILLGYVLRRRGGLSHEGVRDVSSLAVNITCPLLIIASVNHMQGAATENVVRWFGIGMVIYALLPLLAKVLVTLLRVREDERGVYAFMLIFANTELLGFPVVQAFWGDEAIFYTAIIHMPFDLLVYSYGVRLMSGERRPFSLRCLWNSGFVLTVLALVIYFADWHLPRVLVDACYLVGNTTTPLSMLILGASLAEIALRSIFGVPRLYAMAALRLLAIPAIIYLVLRTTGWFSPMLNGIAGVTFGMPVGSMLVMFANAYDRYTQLSTQAVSLTTLGSLLTIPLMAWLL